MRKIGIMLVLVSLVFLFLEVVEVNWMGINLNNWNEVVNWDCICLLGFDDEVCIFVGGLVDLIDDVSVVVVSFMVCGDFYIDEGSSL